MKTKKNKPLIIEKIEGKTTRFLLKDGIPGETYTLPPLEIKNDIMINSEGFDVLEYFSKYFTKDKPKDNEIHIKKFDVDLINNKLHITAIVPEHLKNGLVKRLKKYENENNRT